MKLMTALFLFALAAPVLAIDYPCNKKMDTWEFHKQVLAVGFTLDGVGCSDEFHCVIYNASKDPAAVCAAYIYAAVDRPVQVANNRKAAVALLQQVCTPFPTGIATTDLLCRLGFMLIAQ